MDLLIPASPDAVVSSSDDVVATDPFHAVFAPLKEALEGRGFSELTSIQRSVLQEEIEGRDLQISSQTGSGKTVALGFVLANDLQKEAPEQGSGPEALIIVPTRELATQVSEELGWLFAGLAGVRVASVTGGTPVFRDRQMLSRGPRVLVGTPGRLLDHVKSGSLALGRVRELVLDEADQMLDMGFREELEGILDTTPETRRTHLVSATFPEGIRRLAARYQEDPVAIEGTRLGDANQDIEHVGYLVDHRERYAALVNLLLMADGERTLVFVERRADAVEVAEMLERDGFASLPLSGELAQSQRERTLAAFRAGRATVLVATDVAARGLDVPDVASVIHTAPPIDSQVYTHRSGRTGRAGKSGRSVLFASRNKRRKVIRLLSEAGVDLRWNPVPSADEVRVHLDKRDKERLRASIEELLTTGPSEDHLALAQELLQDREGVPVVAALLAKLQPVRSVEPQDVTDVSEAPAGRYEPQQRPQRDRYDRSARPERRGRHDRSSRGDSVRFFVNWGHNQGANPARLLASICRRGQVDGSMVGSIAIHPNASTFDVQADVAERFERLAGRRDPRDPQTWIRRDRGPQSAPQQSR